MRTLAEKVWDYLVEHKRPVTANQLAKRFIASKSSVARELRLLTERNILDRIVAGKEHFFKIKD
jgi:predicted transcriptional regulator